MRKKITSLAVFVSLFCLVSLVSALPTPPPDAGGGGGNLINPIRFNDFSALLGNIATEVGKLIATLGTIMIIVAGILYLTSAGSPERIGTAKKALIYAIAGIAIGLAAQAIVGIITGIMGASTTT